jgi:hypothetical protein
MNKKHLRLSSTPEDLAKASIVKILTCKDGEGRFCKQCPFHDETLINHIRLKLSNDIPIIILDVWMFIKQLSVK